MTIRQQGGIFGRNPTFNNVTVDGVLAVDQIAEKTGSAGISLDGVTLKDGNVVLSDGKGIDFSATSGTGTSELFDDYEEGTFLPVIVGQTIAGSATYSLQNGYYTKIGNRILFSIRVTWSGHTGTGNMVIDGLPFASSGQTGAGHTATIGWISGLTLSANNILVAYIGGNSTIIVLNQYATGGGGATSVPMDAAAGLIVSGQYFVA
jgi:hypothetical protein